MKKKNYVLFFVMAFMIIYLNIFPCTTAIVSGKFTVDGRPLLVKHRDSSFDQNKLMFFKDGTYSYIGLVNSVDSHGKEVWGGCNSAGFAIMNSASYNLKPDEDKTEIMDREGIIMKLALQQCKTIDDFANLLDTMKKPLGVEANFGVIDADGGCAYFECNNYNYKIIDANDANVAPFGYIIRTNYSFNGIEDEGYGYIRYLAAEKLFYNASAEHDLSCRFILQDVSRSLEHSLTGTNLKEQTVSGDEKKFVFLEDYIVRNSSVSTILVQGVKKGESPKLATIWTILGFQLSSVALPVWVEAGENLPKCLIEDKTGNAPLCEMSLKLKNRIFPIKRGSGYRYMNLSSVMNKEGTGILQQLKPIEDEIFLRTEEKLNKWRSLGHVPKQEAHDFYRIIDMSINDKYKKLLSGK